MRPRNNRGLSGGKKMLALVGLIGAAALSLWATGALAVFPDDNVTHFTGCLSTGGTFSKVAVGDSPSSSCTSGQVVAHLSGGDVTSVNAGSGLSGGGTNGSTTLSLAGGQALPQTCANGQLPKWNSTTSTWGCGNDNNTTYSNGAGLDLSAANQFSVKPSYRLPQNCGSGQVAKSDGSTNWSCQNDENTQSVAYTASNGNVQLETSFTNVTTLNIPNDPGNYVIIATQGFGFSSDGNWATCWLLVNGNRLTQAGGEADGGEIFPETPASATELVATQVTVPGRIEVECQKGEDNNMGVQLSRIVALKVGAIH